MKKYCKACGTQVPNDARFCQNCGGSEFNVINDEIPVVAPTVAPTSTPAPTQITLAYPEHLHLGHLVPFYER